MKVPAHPPLASESVNYVGDHVAVVIAESLDEARSAADLVKVDYKILKAVVETKGTSERKSREVLESQEGVERSKEKYDSPRRYEYDLRTQRRGESVSTGSRKKRCTRE